MTFLSFVRDLANKLPLTYSIVFDLASILNSGGVEDCQTALKVLCEFFSHDERFANIRKTLFPIVLEKFLHFLEESKQSLEVTKQTSDIHMKTINTTIIILKKKKIIWSRGGTGPKSKLPEKNF